MPNAPTDEVARFRKAVDALTGDGSGNARLGVAVSGGPDSMALLYLANHAYPQRIWAATVDHGLRVESAGEAEMVAGYCRSIDVPHATLRPATPITGNVQSGARAARYALLEDWRSVHGLRVVMTAHHGDDQLETILMRLNRGAGVGGLAGIRARNGHVIRPLLTWSKAELTALATEAEIPFVTDPSNSDPRFDRAALRTKLSDVDWLDPAGAVRSAEALADAEAALNWMTDQLMAERLIATTDGWRLDPSNLPAELVRRLLLRALATLSPGGAAPRGPTLDGVIESVAAGGKASIGDCLVAGGDTWTVGLAPPRRHGVRPISS